MKKIPFIIISVLVLPLLWVAVNAQQPASTTTETADPYKELDEKIGIFFEGLIAGNTTTAFENLLLQSPLASTVNGNPSSEMKAKLDEAKPQYGDFIDYELFKHLPVGKDVVVMKYLLKSENYPIVWTFTFYRKPPLRGSATAVSNAWQLIELRFDVNVELLTL
jgi:hypothetical protein